MINALKQGEVQETLVQKNELFSKIVDQLPRGKRDWAAMVTIEGIPGLNTRLLHLKEVSAGRKALLKQLGVEVSEKAAAPKSGPALLKEFRENLVSRGAADQATWSGVRVELQKALGVKTPEAIDELLKAEAPLPSSVWKIPALKQALNSLEERSSNYQSIAEFDEWLAIKRLQKESER